ncbi:cell division protein ZapA [Rhodobacteraceae bacterium NNCM2]|nr:cell division protein ZapA [Coraliihabitans acroporae]
MAEVTVEIGGRDYRLGCGEGEEEGLIAYAKKMDGIAEAISRRIGQPVPEGRLMVMVGMMLADELAEAEAQTLIAQREAEAAKRLAESNTAPNELFNEEAEEVLAEHLTEIAQRIEAISARLG